MLRVAALFGIASHQYVVLADADAKSTDNLVSAPQCAEEGPLHVLTAKIGQCGQSCEVPRYFKISVVRKNDTDEPEVQDIRRLFGGFYRKIGADNLHWTKTIYISSETGIPSQGASNLYRENMTWELVAPSVTGKWICTLDAPGLPQAGDSWDCAKNSSGQVTKRIDVQLTFKIALFDEDMHAVLCSGRPQIIKTRNAKKIMNGTVTSITILPWEKNNAVPQRISGLRVRSTFTHVHIVVTRDKKKLYLTVCGNGTSENGLKTVLLNVPADVSEVIIEYDSQFVHRVAVLTCGKKKEEVCGKCQDRSIVKRSEWRFAHGYQFNLPDFRQNCERACLRDWMCDSFEISVESATYTSRDPQCSLFAIGQDITPSIQQDVGKCDYRCAKILNCAADDFCRDNCPDGLRCRIELDYSDNRNPDKSFANGRCKENMCRPRNKDV
eukprot:GEMP01035406.1.p1 GENE.GEMP01035406.1~~GEMP01035406.1.p1  ORF type:complete len:456 (+),score=38.24 GEMP01035406.1:54-1370(+)